MNRGRSCSERSESYARESRRGPSRGRRSARRNETVEVAGLDAGRILAGYRHPPIGTNVEYLDPG